jgi:hypothetical protein
MSIKIVNYLTLNSDLGNIWNNGCTPTVTLYSNQEGTLLYKDSTENTFSDKVVSLINHNQPKKNSDGAEVEHGYFEISFTDGTLVKIIENVDTVYYGIVAVPFKPRTF